MKNIVCTLLIVLVSCSFSLKDEEKKTPLPQLQIGPDDWLILTQENKFLTSIIKTVKPEKIELLRKNFLLPSLSSFTVPESNGFELYEITGYAELENALYIHPKLYVNSAMDRGSILGYKLESKDEMIEISIPVALVNGLVPSIPIIGGPQNGTNAAVTLPSNFRIEDVEALKNKVGKEIKTLPICPKLFRLSFEGREYWSKSPFESLSNCPLNQFFRIKFKASSSDMKRLLDTAALREEAVIIITDFVLPFEYPVRRVDLNIDPLVFKTALKEELKNIEFSGEMEIIDPKNPKTPKYIPTYSIQDIERAVLNTIFSLSSQAGIKPQLGKGIGTLITEIIFNYFGEPVGCRDKGLCRPFIEKNTPKNPIQYGWLETESLATPITTETISSLGSVANSSRFIANSAINPLSLMRRPKIFENLPLDEIYKQCGELVKAEFKKNPGTSDEEKAFIKEYCMVIYTNASVYYKDPHQIDEYTPFGINTVVYPGAWIRIDLDEIAEFTTAKTRVQKDGSVSIESEVMDLLENQPLNKRTSCIEGSNIACAEYKKTLVPIRDHDGSHLQEKLPCKKEEPGCICENTPSGEETCFKKGQYLYQEVLDYSCDKQDEITYCPYWRDEEQVIGYEREYECQNVKVSESVTFLCINGCSEKYEYQCKEKSRKPIKAIRRVLNCIEDEEERIEVAKKANLKIPERHATAYRVKDCKRPQYKCAKWETSCTRYAVNEAFHIVHEERIPRWRPFAIHQGEYPLIFEENIYLKFVSKNNYVASNCRLTSFPREFRGNTMYIKIPSENNEELPCDKPIWNEENVKPDNLPKVYIKNNIVYPQMRLCGRTEYSFITRELPVTSIDDIVPKAFSFKTEVHIGPIKEACTAPDSFQYGNDLWFVETVPIRFSGRISVLGRMLESILTKQQQ